LKHHILLLLTVAVWGTTFVSTKVLLNCGLAPSEIFFLRFLAAYPAIFLLSPRKLRADSRKDELLFVAAGMTGGSLYFLAENTALEITQASNAALILCTAPLLTALCSRVLLKGDPSNRRLNRRWVFGSLLALTGVAFVVFNGHFALGINPLGDVLALSAALMWALYNVLVKQLDRTYSIAFITRKVFAYGLITVLPVFAFAPFRTDVAGLSRPVVWINLLFLSLVASMLCFMAWNFAMKHLGAVRASSYLYLVPAVTLVTSSLVIGERITSVALLGAAMIVGGVYLAK
jgi:drug/metabolite transporter (DMT)-like permease